MARRNLPDALAAGLMAVVVLRDYGWTWVPAGQQGMVSKGLGALLVLALLAAVWHLAGLANLPRWWLAWPIGYGAWSALQTVLCAALYLMQPWSVPPGVGICSARLDIDLGALGLLIAALFALRASPVSSYSSNKKG